MTVGNPARAAAHPAQLRVIESKPERIAEGYEGALHGVGLGLLDCTFMRRTRCGPDPVAGARCLATDDGLPARTVTRTRATYEHACCRWCAAPCHTHSVDREAPRRPGDPSTMVASNRKIRDVLGWQPAYDDLEFIVRTAWHWEQRLHVCGGPAAFDRSLAAAPSPKAIVR